MNDAETKDHLVAQHACYADYMKYTGPKSRQMLHGHLHREVSDFAVWQQGAPALNAPYDHSHHRHEA